MIYSSTRVTRYEFTFPGPDRTTKRPRTRLLDSLSLFPLSLSLSLLSVVERRREWCSQPSDIKEDAESFRIISVSRICILIEANVSPRRSTHCPLFILMIPGVQDSRQILRRERCRTNLRSTPRFNFDLTLSVFLRYSSISINPRSKFRIFRSFFEKKKKLFEKLFVFVCLNPMNLK